MLNIIGAVGEAFFGFVVISVIRRLGFKLFLFALLFCICSFFSLIAVALR